jgi:hypothetical protein
MRINIKNIILLIALNFIVNHIDAQRSLFLTQNSTPFNAKLLDGLTSVKASSSAYKIKQEFPNSQDGFYWIKNDNINGGMPFQIYADMTTDGGGWTLLLTNVGYAGWTYDNAILRNETTPSLTTNYSIVQWADYIKKSNIGFQYMLEADARNRWGGIWTANQAYSFVSTVNTQTDITRNTTWDTYTYDINNTGSIQPRMPWRTLANTGYLTTDDGSGNWWGTLATGSSGWIKVQCLVHQKFIIGLDSFIKEKINEDIFIYILIFNYSIMFFCSIFCTYLSRVQFFR